MSMLNFETLLSLDFPIAPHRTWKILDGSKLTAFMVCPRKMFYEYVMGWRPTGTNQDLWFGEAFHLGMAHLVRWWHEEPFNEEELVEQCYKIFLNHYRQVFDGASDDIYHPKSPGMAREAYARYIKQYRVADMDDFKLVTYDNQPLIECYGEVMVGDIVLCYRLDKVLQSRHTNAAVVCDYKTGKRHDKGWDARHSLSMQTFGYTHAAHSIFRLVSGFMLEGVFFYKDGPEFYRLQLTKSKAAMSSWFGEFKYWANSLLQEYEQLTHDTPKRSVMSAFPKCPASCGDYFTQCRYYTYCVSQQNPLKEKGPPIGFEVEHWDPSEREQRLGSRLIERKGGDTYAITPAKEPVTGPASDDANAGPEQTNQPG